MRRLLTAIAALATIGCGAPNRTPAPRDLIIEGPAGLLNVDDGGGGGHLPVVFIHSLAGNTTQWAPQLAYLRRTGRAIAIDLRGHGKSEPPKDGKFAPGDYAEDVLRVLDKLEIRRAIVVGHSMGGGVAVALAGLAPSRVTGLLLVDPIDDPSKRPVNEAFEAFLRRIDGPEYATAIEAYWSDILTNAGDGVRQQVLADLKATPQATVVGSMRAMTDFNAQAALSTYIGLVLSVTTPMNEFPSSLHRVIPTVRQERITGTSHWLHLDRPDEFNAILHRFLASIPG